MPLNSPNSPLISLNSISSTSCPKPLPLNHHLSNDQSEKSKREYYSEQEPLMVVGSSTRWNPTPEQLLALEEMYRRGTRTPTAEQIQHIATQLRKFGKIEGKNVFYWFQNHKARERQKRRREIELVACNINHHQQKQQIIIKESSPGLRKTTGFGVEQTKNYSQLSEELMSNYQSGTRGWIQFDERELQQVMMRKSTSLEMNATWQRPTTATATDDENLMKKKQAIFYQGNNNNCLFISNNNNNPDENQTQKTLELFPLESRSNDVVNKEEKKKKEEMVMTAIINTGNLKPNQYIEFLPLKK